MAAETLEPHSSSSLLVSSLCTIASMKHKQSFFGPVAVSINSFHQLLFIENLGSPAFAFTIVNCIDKGSVVPIFNDYSSVGYSLLLKREKAIIVQPDRVLIGNGPAFGCVLMKDFLKELAKKIKKNTTAFENYSRIFVPEGKPLKCEPNEPLRVNVLFQHIQKMLTSDTAVIAETGDSWFNCQKLKFPN